MQRQIDAILKRINPKIHYKKKGSYVISKNSVYLAGRYIQSAISNYVLNEILD